MDDATKRVACRMIAGLVASDDDFSDSERQFLDKVLHQFRIPESEWDAIFPLLEHDAAEQAIRSLDATAQREIFELLLEAALLDGRIAAAERDYIETVGRAIGMSGDELALRFSG